MPNSIYFNKIFLCSKQSCIFPPSIFVLNIPFSIGLSVVHLMIAMLFALCINAVSPVQPSLRFSAAEIVVSKYYGRIFPEGFKNSVYSVHFLVEV